MSLKYLNLTGLSNLVTNIKNWVTARIPTKTSEITNDSGFITSSSLPTVNNATLTIQKNGTNVQTFTANASSNKTANITVPTAVSELTNDSGFITSSSLPTVNNATLTIQKNGTTVKTFTANASSNVTCNITVPTAVSELTNDSGFLTSHQSLSNYSTLANTVKSLSISGKTITVTPGSGSTYTLTTQDTVYTHPTTAGNKHIPSGGSSGQFLGWDSDGTAKWVNNPNTDTDTKVTQTVTTADSYYPLLACATADNTSSETTTSRFSKGLEVRARYGMIRSYNCYNSSAILGSSPGSDVLAGGIYFADYNKTTVSYALSYVYSSGRTALLFRVYNKLTDGTYATDGTSVNGYFRLNYDTTGKYIDTDMYWNSNLTPLSTNSKSLGTSSLKWKEVYATTFYGALTGNVTGNCSGTSANVTGTVAIANGGTGATTRLNAVKALTNENVGTNTQYLLTITQNWGKAGYCSVADARNVLSGLTRIATRTDVSSGSWTISLNTTYNLVLFSADLNVSGCYFQITSGGRPIVTHNSVSGASGTSHGSTKFFASGSYNGKVTALIFTTSSSLVIEVNVSGAKCSLYAYV